MTVSREIWSEFGGLVNISVDLIRAENDSEFDCLEIEVARHKRDSVPWWLSITEAQTLRALLNDVLRDSDRNPEGEDRADGLRAKHESAGLKGIANA